MQDAQHGTRRRVGKRSIQSTTRLAKAGGRTTPKGACTLAKLRLKLDAASAHICARMDSIQRPSNQDKVSTRQKNELGIERGGLRGAYLQLEEADGLHAPRHRRPAYDTHITAARKHPRSRVRIAQNEGAETGRDRRGLSGICGYRRRSAFRSTEAPRGAPTHPSPLHRRSRPAKPLRSNNKVNSCADLTIGTNAARRTSQGVAEQDNVGLLDGVAGVARKLRVNVVHLQIKTNPPLVC